MVIAAVTVELRTHSQERAIMRSEDGQFSDTDCVNRVILRTQLRGFPATFEGNLPAMRGR